MFCKLGGFPSRDEDTGVISLRWETGGKLTTKKQIREVAQSETLERRNIFNKENDGT